MDHRAEGWQANNWALRRLYGQAPASRQVRNATVDAELEFLADADIGRQAIATGGQSHEPNAQRPGGQGDAQVSSGGIQLMHAH